MIGELRYALHGKPVTPSPINCIRAKPVISLPDLHDFGLSVELEEASRFCSVAIFPDNIVSTSSAHVGKQERMTLATFSSNPVVPNKLNV